MSDQSEPAPGGASAPAGQPGRYQRTTQGLVASMIVTVLAVLVAFFLLRLDNGGAEQDPEPVDYREAVDAATGAGISVLYPEQLPQGWIATSVDLLPSSSPEWGIGFLTTDGSFVGVRQGDDDVDDMLETYVDDEAVRGDDVTFDTPLADPWTRWSDEGGDVAYTAEVPVGGVEQTVMVYGSADAADLRLLLESLVAS